MNNLQTTKEGLIIVHRPIFDTVIVSQHYSEKDKVPVKYVCTTSLTGRGAMLDVFYRSTPHPEFGNKYFGLYWAEVGPQMQMMVAGADSVEDLQFDMIKDSEGHYHYSRYVHDYHTVVVGTGSGVAIDGGREYTKTVGGPDLSTFKVKDGEFYVD